MRPRDPEEEGRSASTLELFFDLVFVVAVSVAAGSLHHQLTHGHVVDGVTSYLLVFFAIWWAWMNFTWFASAFDTDDWLYRVLTVLQMGGVLLLAAGVREAFEGGELVLVTLGYVVMRVAMVAQWLRAAHGSPLRRTAHAYAVGIVLVQVLWLLRLLLPPETDVASFVVLALAEMAVPFVAEKVGETPWHAHHLTERYGLFTLILLGESLLASANAIFDALETGDHVPELVALAALALVATAALWWIYFWAPHHHVIRKANFLWGYGHYFIFAAAGAFSAGIEVQIDAVTHHTELSDVEASFTLTIPIAVFVLGVWALAVRPHADRVVNLAVPLGAVLVLCDPLIPLPSTVSAFVLVLVVVVLVRHDPREDQPGESAPDEIVSP
ncbi:low temperature requirement protein A [Nocardioides immobilis]|uniref:Low temperature requirement protein A n=2 Tax=Nocardioides immobilis TaxID=2049295 RepID=A0A417Y1M5_9ACTN|nr:low temperature requirement protein A [Nocardioides immobilis]